MTRLAHKMIIIYPAGGTFTRPHTTFCVCPNFHTKTIIRKIDHSTIGYNIILKNSTSFNEIVYRMSHIPNSNCSKKACDYTSQTYTGG